MDIATRKRVMSMSANFEPHALPPKIQAPIPDPTSNFADILIVHVLNALNVTDPIQRLPFIEDLMSRLQWLKQYHQKQEALIKKPIPSENGSPSRHPEHKSLDHQDMKKCIQKDQEMLQSMSKLIGISAQTVPPMGMMQPPHGIKIVAPEAPKVPEPKKSPSLPQSSLPPPPPALPAMNSIPPALQKSILKKKKDNPSPPPLPSLPLPFPFNPVPQMTQNAAEEMMLNLQEQQRKLLTYISAAHGGSVTDEVLHEYLRHPYVLLRENGVTRKQQNPFFHLMNQNGANMKMIPPAPSVILKPNEKSTTPIPAPPLLVPQVELAAKKDSTPPTEKSSPPPQLPPQLPLQIPLTQQPNFDSSKPFEPPATRVCNQWSVVSMALPLTLMCRCYQTPCRCKGMTA
ncbi:unnamed protein product [Caenorhabditis nigoni]